MVRLHYLRPQCYPEYFKKPLVVFIVLEEGLAAVPPDHYMIDPGFASSTYLSWHVSIPFVEKFRLIMAVM